jgi:DNA invertase Pin-like site-specific DNA recombinase
MTKPTKRVALYLRVSTTEQTTDNQRLELDAVIKRCDWKTVEVYEDHGIRAETSARLSPA